MQNTSAPKFAARLNAFKIGAKDYWPGKNKITTGDLLSRAATAGLTATDLNFPDHFFDTSLSDLRQTLDEAGILAKIAVIEPTGSETHLLLRGNEQDLTSVLRERRNYSPGQEIHLSAAPDTLHIFDYHSKQRLH